MDMSKLILLLIEYADAIDQALEVRGKIDQYLDEQGIDQEACRREWKKLQEERKGK